MLGNKEYGKAEGLKLAKGYTITSETRERFYLIFYIVCIVFGGKREKIPIERQDENLETTDAHGIHNTTHISYNIQHGTWKSV